MSDDLLDQLEQIGRATLRLSAALERLPLGRAAPSALLVLATDPGALLDECLAPLVLNGAPVGAEDQDGEPVADLPARLGQRPMPLNGAPGRDARRDHWPDGRSMQREPPQPRVASGMAPQAPYAWEPARQPNPAAAAWPNGDNADGMRERLPNDWGAGIASGGAASDERITATPFHSPLSLLASEVTDASGGARSAEADLPGTTARPVAPAGGSANGDAWRAAAGVPNDGAPQGLRITRGAAALSAVLRANIRRPDAAAPPGGDAAGPAPSRQAPDWAPQLPAPGGWDARLDRARYEHADLAVPAATVYASQPPAIMSDEQSALQPATAEPALDIDAIMRELADRLEFEYMRMYGTSGD